MAAKDEQDQTAIEIDGIGRKAGKLRQVITQVKFKVRLNELHNRRDKFR